MVDIYDIKDNILWLPIDFFYSIIFVLFYIIFYVILSKYFNKEKNEEASEMFQRNISTNREYLYYSKLLKCIEKNYLDSSKEIFYSKLSWIIREFLEEKENLSISKMTFEEIKRLNLEKNTENIIEDIYFREFSENIEDSVEFRKEILGRIRKLVK